MSLEPQMHVIVPSGDGTPAVLLVPSGDAWTLPALSAEGQPDNPFELADYAMRATLAAGLAITPLHFQYAARKTAEHGWLYVVATERRDDAPAPEDSRWLTAGELADTPLDHEHLRRALAVWFHERVTGDVPPLRVPWAFPGWREQAVSWIVEQVAADGSCLTGDISLVRSWCITCVLKAPTDKGNLYFKAVPPVFAREIAVTRLLAARHQDVIPAVAAADTGRRWLLLRDFDAAPPDEKTEAGVWAQILRAYAALQLDMATQIGPLFDAGANEYRLGPMHEKLDATFADDAYMQPDHRISAEEIARLRSYAPRLHATIDELDAFGLPDTIVHGDFHTGNVAVNGARTVFFDWTDSGVGHIFLDTAFFVTTMNTWLFRDDPAPGAHARAAYLDALSSLAAPDVLERAFMLAETVCLLHQAVNYRPLSASVEPAARWQIAFGSVMLKRLLTRLEES